MIIFSPKQEEAMDALASEQYQFILYGGAVGGGKTVWGLGALLIMCQIFKGSRWVVIRQDLERIRTTTIPSFRKLSASGKLRESPFEYTHPNGSQILFKGENYDNDKELLWLSGLEASGFLFEEINECQQQTLEVAFSRAGRWDSNPRPSPIVLATCNPSKGWVKELIYDRHINGTLPPTWIYIQSKVHDNPHLTQAYIDNLKNLPRYKYEVLVEGNWDLQMKVGGEFYKCFELEKHVGECIYNPQLPLHISFDENVNPYLPLGIYQIEGTHIKQIDEIAGKNPDNTIQSVCDTFRRRYKGHTSGLFIYGDATSKKDDVKLEKGYNFFVLVRDALAEFKPQLRISKSNPSVAMRAQFINKVFESEWNGLKLTIDKSCKLSILDFVMVKEMPDGSKNKEMDTDPLTKVRHQKYGHFSDLFDYLICMAFAELYNKYQYGGVGQGTRFLTGGESRNRY
jgi:hypothetical protein